MRSFKTKTKYAKDISRLYKEGYRYKSSSGIMFMETPAHGYIILTKEQSNRIPIALRNASHMYEEDCESAIVSYYILGRRDFNTISMLKGYFPAALEEDERLQILMVLEGLNKEVNQYMYKFTDPNNKWVVHFLKRHTTKMSKLLMRLTLLNKQLNKKK